MNHILTITGLTYAGDQVKEISTLDLKGYLPKTKTTCEKILQAFGTVFKKFKETKDYNWDKEKECPSTGNYVLTAPHGCEDEVAYYEKVGDSVLWVSHRERVITDVYKLLRLTDSLITIEAIDFFIVNYFPYLSNTSFSDIISIEAVPTQDSITFF